MKILFINKFLYPRGGAESYMLKLGKCLSEMGHTLEYFGMYDEKNTVSNECSLYTRHLDFHSSGADRLLYPFRIIYSTEAKRKLGTLLDSFKPDIVHMNNINFQLTPSVISAVKERNIPLFWTLHDYQLICPNHLCYNERCGGTCERCIKNGRYECVKNRCIHNSFAKSIIGAAESIFYDAVPVYEKVDCFISPSYFLANKLKRAKLIFEKKTVVMHNFIEPPPKERNGSPLSVPYVAFAGRLSREKGTRILAQTAKLLPNVTFYVMGSGPDRAELEGIPNIILPGFVSGQALTDAIANASVMAVPSVCLENCPLAITEAQVLGVPTVTMPIGGMAELVRNGVTGTLAKQVTPHAFAEALFQTLSNTEKLEKMRENCLEAAKSALTVQDYADRLLTLYGKQLSDKEN